MYVVGAALRSLSRKSEAGRNLSKKLYTNKENVAEKLKCWIESQDRGGLFYPTEEAFKFFLNIYKHVGRFFGQVYTLDRAEKARETVLEDEHIKQTWFGFCEGAVEEPHQLSLLKHCVRYFVNTVANGHLKKLKDDLKAENRLKALKSKCNSKERLRKQMQQASKLIR